MQSKYRLGEEVPDEAIVEAFAHTQRVSLSVRRFNSIEYLKIGLDGIGWWLPFKRVIKLIGCQASNNI
jgi:hypothetical protein